MGERPSLLLSPAICYTQIENLLASHRQSIQRICYMEHEREESAGSTMQLEEATIRAIRQLRPVQANFIMTIRNSLFLTGCVARASALRARSI
jgi:hypothetical protein